MTTAEAIWWVGRDLRLADNPALRGACAAGRVLPVFVIDEAEQRLGAAAGWRLAQSLQQLDADLRARHSRLIVRRGRAADVLAALARDTGAGVVHVNSALPFFPIDRDGPGVPVTVHPGNWLLPPGRLKTGAGRPYQKFTPFWKSLRGCQIAEPVDPPDHLSPPSDWPDSLPVARWGLGVGMNRGADVLARFARIGEAAAQDRLAVFLDDVVAGYAEDRDRPDCGEATSGLSDALALGEISARQIWHATRAREMGRGAESFLSELAWRDFARDLHFQAPDLAGQEWKADWAAFPWRGDNADAEAWRRGLTGVDLVDAGMRELYATGKMHNRVRMVVASFLTKHLMTDWRVGLAWFADCLTDWDPASNAMNWQWVAGCGPDSAPFFRIFNPDTQAEKFDPDGVYRDFWLRGDGDAAFRAAIPRSWDIPGARPDPIIALAEGRARALAAYHAM